MQTVTTFFLQELWPLWRAGGWLMVPLVLVAVLIYFQAFALYAQLWGLTVSLGGKLDLQAAVQAPERLRGEPRRMLEYALGGSGGDVRSRFDEVRSAHLPFIDRRLRFVGALVMAAPLLGLLGTIIGMLATFHGLGTAGAGQTTNLVAGGISQALVTTQTGLVVAIPGYVVLSWIQRRRNLLAGSLARMESIALREQKGAA